MRPQVSEQQVAAIVVAWLEALGADVYQEVECAGGVADIVAVRGPGPELTIIETKTSWSLAVLVQAMERHACAHRVYIAAPYSRHGRDMASICEALGIGVLEVHAASAGCDSGEGYGKPAVREIVSSARWNRRPVALRAQLRPEHKTSAKAGSAIGGRWTPFRDTCAQLERVVSREPGIALKAAIVEIKHHYRTGAIARSSLATWIAAGKVAGVRLENGLLYPTEKS